MLSRNKITKVRNTLKFMPKSCASEHQPMSQVSTSGYATGYYRFRNDFPNIIMYTVYFRVVLLMLFVYIKVNYLLCVYIRDIE